MATALLVAGPTLPFWIPWQTQFAFTYSYSRSFKALGFSFQLSHMSRDDNAVQLIKFERAMAAKTKTKHYYNAHNVATRVRFGT